MTSGIWTTDRLGGAGYNPGGGTDGDVAGSYTNSFGGTSSSCPGVAGVAALMLAANNDLTSAQVKAIIKNSCDKIDAEFGDYDANGHSPFYGYGKINADTAVENAIMATDTEKVNYEVNGGAEFSKIGEVSITGGQPTVKIPAKSRLLSMALNVNPFCPTLSLEYKTVINGKEASAWTKAESFSGTADGRRKMIGFAIRLTGDLSNQYEVLYQAKLKGKEDWVAEKNGKICGTTKKGGKAIEQIKMEIVKREM